MQIQSQLEAIPVHLGGLPARISGNTGRPNSVYTSRTGSDGRTPLGLLAALGISKFISSLLMGVTSSDPLTFITVALVLIVAAFLACYIPARRAMRLDPLVALRYES